MTLYKLEISKNKEELANNANDFIAGYIKSILNKQDKCRIALSGGSTPEKTYELLSHNELPWERVEIFLGDERWVEANHKLSNVSMLKKTLLSSNLSCKAKFYPIPTIECSSPEESAELFHNQINSIFDSSPPTFDLILLGLGDDGHTASLFPGSESLKISNKWATSSLGKGIPRVTLTSPVLSSARKVVFLISGSNKREALIRLLDPSESSERTPAKLAKPEKEILILTDVEIKAN